MKMHTLKKIHLMSIPFVLSLCFFIGFGGSCPEKGEDNGTDTEPDSENLLGTFPDFTPDLEDATSPDIEQTIPPAYSTGIAPSTIITIFFDDEIDPSTISSATIKVYSETTGNDIAGQFGGTLSEAGNTIVVFAPTQSLPENEAIVVELPAENGIKDDGGNGLAYDYMLEFSTSNAIAAVPDGNLGFELSSTGFAFSGDGAILSSPAGSISPTEGSKMAAITSGAMIVSESYSLNYTTSLLITGAITVPAGATTLIFDYDFFSEEFDDWVGSEFDDTFVVSVSGSSGLYAELVTSVNIVGAEASVPVDLSSLGIYDGDHTGWISKSIPVSALGSPISISFSVSDVGDTAYDTIVFIDNIHFE